MYDPTPAYSPVSVTLWAGLMLFCSLVNLDVTLGVQEPESRLKCPIFFSEIDFLDLALLGFQILEHRLSPVSPLLMHYG